MVHPIRSLVNDASRTVLQMGISATIGYLFARTFTIINPWHAAVFSASSVLVSKVVEPIFNRIFGGSDSNEASKFLGKVINITACVAIGAAVSTLIGYPIPFTAGLVIWLGVIVTEAVIDFIIGKAQHAERTA